MHRQPLIDLRVGKPCARYSVIGCRRLPAPLTRSFVRQCWRFTAPSSPAPNAPTTKQHQFFAVSITARRSPEQHRGVNRIGRRRRRRIAGIRVEARFDHSETPLQLGNLLIPPLASRARRLVHPAMLQNPAPRSCAAFHLKCHERLPNLYGVVLEAWMEKSLET
jgi:hypothetical protein